MDINSLLIPEEEVLFECSYKTTVTNETSALTYETKLYITNFRLIECCDLDDSAVTVKLSSIKSIGVYDTHDSFNDYRSDGAGDYGIAYDSGTITWFASKQVRDDFYRELSRAVLNP